MFGSNILEVAIGLIFIFLLYSLLATTLKEGVAAVLDLRGRMLQLAIRRMLNDGASQPGSLWKWLGIKLKKLFIFLYGEVRYIIPFLPKKENKMAGLAGDFYEHPGIKYLTKGRMHNKPSYISPQTFSKVVSDILKEAGHSEDPDTSFEDKLNRGIDLLPVEDENKKLLHSFYQQAEGDVERFKQHLEEWFNETMDRASGWYKKQTQVIILIIGFALAVVFNVDTINIVKNLSRDKDARNGIVNMAVAYHNDTTKMKAWENRSKDPDTLFNYAKDLLQNDIKNADGLLGLGWEIPQRFDPVVVPYNRFNENENEVCGNCLLCMKGAGEKQSFTIYMELKDMYLNCMNKIDNLKIKNKVKALRRTRAIYEGGLVILKFRSDDEKLTGFQKAEYVICSTFSSSRKLLGFSITALAISFGAPFWFDLLNKLIQFRGSGKKPDEDEKKK